MTALRIVAIGLLLSACGGVAQMVAHTPATDGQSAAYEDSWAPVIRVDRTVFVGSGIVETFDADDVMETIHGKQSTDHGGVALVHGYIRNGVGRQYLADYLAADATPGGIWRFSDTPPVVRAAVGTGDSDWWELSLAVEMINSALPAHWQIRIDQDRTSRTEPDRHEVIVSFERGEGCYDRAVGCAFPYSYPTGEVDRGRVWLDFEEGASYNSRLGTIVHELLHILGRGHPDPYEFPETITRTPTLENSGFVLTQLDREALLAVYDRLDYGTQPEDMYDELGYWEDVSVLIQGAQAIPGGSITFGAAELNGHVQGWAYGPRPLESLEDNTNLSARGRASWSGRLLGMTPDTEAVAGAADLSVRLEHLEGDLDFTDMEMWRTGQAPGEIGTGKRWRNGELHYEIVVSGNEFWSNDDRDGFINGSFFGIAHEGMGGVVKRDDLTAGFGGELQ